MADTFITTTTAAVSIPEIWSQKLYEVLIKNLVVANLVNRDYEGDIREKGDKVHIVSIPSDLTVSDVSEGVAVDAVASTLTENVLTIDKNKAIHIAISHLSKIQSSINLLSGYSDRMGYNLAKQIDSDLIVALKAGVSAAAPDHIIPGTGAAGIFNPNDDVLTAKGLLDAQDVGEAGRWMVMNPADYNKILAVSANQSRDFVPGQPLVSGQVAPLFGFSPLKSTQMTEGEVLFGVTSACTLAIQAGVSFNTYDMRAQGIHADRVVADVLYGSKVLDGKRIVLLNATGA